ncbi:MAG: hypothetical protein CO094_12945 [Anaerolineae bacterium CG_4_9_14_3_um_filter_57_17]|nr:hypothetical protein [bacterium]NCT21240.1 hypothetical protein [bacterium]OIO86456.1 MAG: hypothetical protein AUK01_02965 [Anaerolineae bacterium CG2_30_57_67]PJB64437.1 MAG: hypothetical protein CO094_12945 [Anaerolineae bacterium CG_4_9_14_3_um_filter_57_17]
MNRNLPIQFLSALRGLGLKRGALFGGILLVALLAFEVFNYTTTDFALSDVLGNDLKFLGLRWATILSIAFCAIDFAGVARLFTPEQGRDEPAEVWYLFGAWILAAGMNATLTWWGVAVAINSHVALGAAIVGRATVSSAVPVFVAVMVWLIRILIIGTFSMAGERLFSLDEARPTRAPAARYENVQPSPARAPMPRPLAASPAAAPRPRPEPTYHPAGMSSSPAAKEKSSGWRV